MGPLDSLNHLLNFLAPAFWMALFMAMLGPLVLRSSRGLGRSTQWLLDFAVCSAVLLAGLWITGRDGKMLTYGALVLAYCVRCGANKRLQC